MRALIRARRLPLSPVVHVTCPRPALCRQWVREALGLVPDALLSIGSQLWWVIAILVVAHHLLNWLVDAIQ